MKKNIFIIVIEIFLIAQSFIQIDIQCSEVKPELSKEEFVSLRDSISYNENLEEIKELIKSFDLKSHYGTKLLQWAVNFNINQSIIELFLQQGADINAQNKNGKTALMYSSNPEILKLLLNNGANPLITRNDKTVCDLFMDQAHILKEVQKKEIEHNIKEDLKKQHKKYIESAILVKEWPQYKKFLSKWRLRVILMLIRQGKLTRKNLKMIVQKNEPNFEEWFSLRK